MGWDSISLVEAPSVGWEVESFWAWVDDSWEDDDSLAALASWDGEEAGSSFAGSDAGSGSVAVGSVEEEDSPAVDDESFSGSSVAYNILFLLFHL